MSLVTGHSRGNMVGQSRWLLPAVVAVLAMQSSFLGQSAPCDATELRVEGGPFFEAWVDPINGADGGPTAGLVSDPLLGSPDINQAKASPFQTIQAAVDAVAALVSLPGNPGIVHLEPGIYDPLGGVQTFPISMRNGVNIQGINARECVLRRGAERERVFYPIPTGAQPCACGVREPRRVIIDYTSATAEEEEEEYAEAIDSVTFQGGEVQVYVDSPVLEENPIFHAGRISNCIFDMIDYQSRFTGPQFVSGPEFGLLMVHPFGDIGGDTGYEEIQMSVFNNTFVMGWWPDEEEEPIASSPTAVGICDVNDPKCPDGDPDKTLRNVGRSNIQNNLFRELSSGTSTAFLGVPVDDRAVALPGQPVDTNVFLFETIDNGTYCVRYREPSFNAAQNVIPYDDPAFVGEMLTNRFALPDAVGRDWRVLPDSLVVDAGTNPVNGTLTAFNGLVYTEPSFAADCSFSAIDSFDFDGEGYGNRRVIDGDNDPSAVVVVDVGADEFEHMIDSGFGSGSLNIPNVASPCTLPPPLPGNPCYCVPVAGAGSHGFIVRGGGNVTLRIGFEACPTSSYSRRPTTAAPTIQGAHVFWFPTPPVVLTGLTPTVFTYTPPDTASLHTFGLLNRASVNSGTFGFFQGRYGGKWSSLQVAFD